MVFDPISESRLKEVLPDLAYSWKQVRDKFWEKNGMQIRVSQGLRTYAEQWDLYSKGRLKDKDGTWIICDIRKVVTHAKAGESLHNFGLSLDSCFIGKDPYLSQLKKEDQERLWNDYGTIAKAQGLVWGGDWVGSRNDRPHVENAFGMSLHELQMLYEEGGLPRVWSKCQTYHFCGRPVV